VRAYEQFARLVSEAGAHTVFGVLGDGNMHWVAAYRELPGCRWLPAWHEAGAVWMADGFAGHTGEVGVATVTMGPGLAQALPAVMTAVRAGRSVVVITAALPDVEPALAQFADQQAMVRAAGACYVRVRDARRLSAGLARALEEARHGTPAVLAIDLAIFETAAATEQQTAIAGPAVATELDGDEIDAAAAVLAAARSPVVLLGAGVRTSGSVEAALELGRRIGALVGTTIGGRTPLPQEPGNLGVLGMMADPVARELVASADVLLVLGAALDRYNSDGGQLGRDSRIVRVDRRPGEALWSPRGDVLHVTGELPRVLAALAERLPATTTHRRTDETRALLDGEQARQRALVGLPTDDGPNPWAVVHVLERELPPDAHVVVGIGHFWYFVAPYLRPEPSRTFHFACGFASIGQAIPVGVGAALADAGRPVVVIDGDGSAVMNIQELQAAVRHGADLLVIVLDNRAYGSEYHKLALARFDVAASTFEDVPFDVVAVAAAMGATARSADSPAELAATLRELIPLRGVRLIAARISVTTMSETYARQHGKEPSTAATGSSHSAASSAHPPTDYPPR
jgi:thiamine pyrophosphate-dependent acetolactate synthase large subunit-like protein